MSDLVFMFFADAPDQLVAAAAAGIERVVIDCETRGKRERQAGYDTEISAGSFGLIAAARTAGCAEVVCRINGPHAGSAPEIDDALAAGANWLCFPMLRTASQLCELLQAVRGRARTIAMLETREALANLPALLACPVDEFYVGLNDLAIELGQRFAFQFLADPRMAILAGRLTGRPWGVGGLTVLDGGAPLPAAALLKEYAYLGCTRFILRRAFRRDIRGRDWNREMARLREHYRAARRRSTEAASADHERLLARIRELAA